MDLWDFSLAFYEASGVADACLSLQDTHGIDVNLVTLAAWIGSTRGVELNAACERLARAVAPWSRDVVQPLRSVRRAIKAPHLLVLNGASELRDRIKQSELQAERVEQEFLQELVADLTGTGELDVWSAELAQRNIELMLDSHASPPISPSAVERRVLYSALAAL
jgi:uncharacterized protein (TIGR02444 family)